MSLLAKCGGCPRFLCRIDDYRALKQAAEKGGNRLLRRAARLRPGNFAKFPEVHVRLLMRGTFGGTHMEPKAAQLRWPVFSMAYGQ